jgi:hypothetical protein
VPECILGSTDTAELDRWLVRAVTAERIDELFADAEG